MNKLLVSLAVGGFLLGQGLSSQAVTVQVTVPSVANPGPASNNNFITPGVFSDDSSSFRAFLTGQNSIFNDASNVTYGVTQQGTSIAPGSSGSNTFTNKSGLFNFDVTLNGITNTVQVIGALNGSSTILGSGAGITTVAYTVSSLVLNGTTISTTVALEPSGSRPALVLSGVNFGANTVDIYVEKNNNVTAPNSANVLSVRGYITAVPEPGAVSLLLGTGAGSLLLLRRRRRA